MEILNFSNKNPIEMIHLEQFLDFITYEPTSNLTK